MVLEVQNRTEDLDIEHNFEFGRPVSFFREEGNGSIAYYNFIATVSYADEVRMVVVLPGTGTVSEPAGGRPLGRSNCTLTKLLITPCLKHWRRCYMPGETVVAELRDNMLGSQSPTFRQLYPVCLPWLNPKQRNCSKPRPVCTRCCHCARALRARGKTTTLVEAIYETLRREPQSIGLCTEQYCGRLDIRETGRVGG